jgi:hypothetical protein
LLGWVGMVEPPLWVPTSLPGVQMGLSQAANRLPITHHQSSDNLQFVVLLVF